MALYPTRQVTQHGFTLVEMLLVVTVIAILSAAIYPSFSGTQAQGRDAERQTDLRNLQVAIENYKRKEGRYPEGAAGLTSWSTGTSHGPDYIQGLWPDYVTELPNDPLPQGNDGYAYRTNADGTVYKLMARGTVESIDVTSSHPLAPCSEEMCDCNENSQNFKTSFAVWGGFANESNPLASGSETRSVVCAL